MATRPERTNSKMPISSKSFSSALVSAQWQELFFDNRYSSVALQNPNFIKIAEGFGVEGKTINHVDQLEGAIQEMLEHDGPYLLHVEVQKEENIFPMIASGSAVDEMRLE